ncbi:SusD/RagB family nutrient-binding outer membrane lipoprotein [Cytophagales bacterium LB-30]|uniref:SusD/RagB family nutrient-binding outer membrane lipoprotein n=1 Tax=Shiella aurantiaca TaxID=3058365 RepID=A0ABT8F6E3_9BACT|nr:SusD/RagB family nutrient-binding outer membrane lipoprotein [Shiella aurantiaca]MDN4165935.1 SusD/RagB family nutrient-binding outer membrane lipoprotein [Shiella aurantiaca]
MKKKIFILFAVAFASVMSSCNDYLDVNTDPNNPTSADPYLILPVAQNYTARWMHSDRRVSHLGNMLMYNWSESAGFSWYNDEFLYQVNTNFYGGIFNDAYLRALKQYALLDSYDPEVYGAYVAIGKIMKSYTFQILTDFYGDIPYFDALQRSNNPSPKYDAASEIYDDLIIQLTEAIAMIDAAEANATSIFPEGDDMIFGGDMLMWKQFANTIKVRILNRVASAKGDAYVNTELAAIAAEGSGFITSNVVITPDGGYLNEEDKQNPFWEDFGANVAGSPTLSGQATCASDFMIQLLQDNADSRIDYLFEQPATGHLGVPQGITADPAVYAPSLVSNIGPALLQGPEQGSIIFTLAEHNFNMAELALNGFGGDPQTFYEAGVTAAFNTLGAPIGSYLNQPFANYVAASDKLEVIITQKWLAVQGLTAEQSWFDHTRTGYPSDLPISQEAPNLVRPVRLLYPASETSGNSANIPAQANPFTDKQFWAN